MQTTSNRHSTQSCLRAPNPTVRKLKARNTTDECVMHGGWVCKGVCVCPHGPELVSKTFLTYLPVGCLAFVELLKPTSNFLLHPQASYHTALQVDKSH